MLALIGDPLALIGLSLPIIGHLVTKTSTHSDMGASRSRIMKHRRGAKRLFLRLSTAAAVSFKLDVP